MNKKTIIQTGRLETTKIQHKRPMNPARGGGWTT